MSEREPANMMDKGTKKYRERIHRESKYADTHKNLPFKFSKPTKERPRNTCVVCEGCEKNLYVTETTIVVVCGQCKHVTKVKKSK